MKISIAMATYNGEKYLEEQLDSILKQTVQPDELVVCDDGSTDNTVEILKSFAKSTSFPVHIYINDINLGYVDNFFKVASLCEGDWISFCDQDDVWLPSKLEKVRKVIYEKEDDDLLLIAHSAEKVTKNLEFMGQRSPNFKRSEIIGKNQRYAFAGFHGFACIVHHKLISDFDWTKRPSDFNSGKKQAHDVWICMLTNALGNMYTIKEPLVHWRRHNTAKTLSISDIEVPTLKSKIKNSQNFGSELYAFRAIVARESSDTMKLLANDYKEDIDTYNSLMEESILFDILSKNLFSRKKLYASKSFLGKLQCFIQMCIDGTYFGNKFYAFGWKSFLKDLHHIVIH